jgi:hypothetical protein
LSQASSNLSLLRTPHPMLANGPNLPGHLIGLPSKLFPIGLYFPLL